MQNFLGHGSKCDIVPSLLCYHAGIEVNHFTSDDELFELASHVLRSFLLTMKSSEQNHIQMLCVCLCLLRRRCSRLRVLFTTRNVVLSFSSGQNFGPLLLKLAICTCGWNLNIMEVKWKAGIFLLGVILLLIWNLLSSTTSCSLYMCQISDSVVSVLVFELFMCVANHTKCY